MIPSVVFVDMLEPALDTILYPSTDFCQMPRCFATPTTTLTTSEGVVEKGGVVEQFPGMFQTCPGFLTPKLGNYGQGYRTSY